MYTRQYNDEGRELRIPENYVGTAFSEPQLPEEKDFEGETESEEYTSVSSEKATRGDGFLSGLFGKGLSELIPASLFSGIPKSLGTEEILLIGVAAFLFFSSSHDVLTAVILLALIFIK
jgi:hypothetical protein